MTLNPTWIFIELLVGGIGFVLFTYGRKLQRTPHLVVGVLFILYPWVVTSTTSLVLVGLLLLGGLWSAVRLGW